MAQLKNIDREEDTLINKNMLLSIISLATKEIEGVVDLYQSRKLIFALLFDKNTSKGVRVKYSKTGIIIDVFIVVNTNVEVNELVYKVQQNIKNSIATLLPMKIKAINVHVKDAQN